MENKLASITTEGEMIRELFHVNYLTAYPISDHILEGWARSIIQLRPDITPEMVRSAIDKMKQGIIQFDHRKGIQNIFVAFAKSTITI